MKKKKNILILLSFLIPFLILISIFSLKGVLDRKIIFGGDMLEQYYPLYSYLKDVFEGTKNIFYNFNKSLGGTMFGTIFYYLSSPLNLLLLFIDKVNIINFMTILIVIKISLCGLTMYLYMSRKFKTDNAIILIFSISYALMGYNLNYYVNIMWLDVVYMAPLVLIGIDKIIENKSPLFYIISLFISIFANYYISYMLCLFSVLYFIYEILLKYNIKQDKQIIKKLVIKFILSSLASGLLCSFFLIPCIIESRNYGREINLSTIFTFDYNFFDLFSKTYIGTSELNNPLNYTSMILYCGIIIPLLVYLYLTNINIDKKERYLSVVFLILLIVPCFIGCFNYIWHLFTIPNFYSFRYSFLVCLLLITLGYKSIINLNINKIKILLYLVIYLIISLYFIIITHFGNYYSFLDYKKIWITLIFLIIYIVILHKMQDKKTISKFLITTIIIEILLNIAITYKDIILIERKELENIIKINEKYINQYNEKNYRIGNEKAVTLNDSLLLDYSNVTNFLSTTNYNYLKFLAKISENTDGYRNVYLYENNNFLLDSLIGNKIVITKQKNKFYNLIDTFELEDKKYYIYKNPYALSIGYMVNEKIKNDNDNKELIAWQNTLFTNITNIDENYIQQYKLLETNDNEYVFYVDNKSDEFILSFDRNTSIIEILINNEKLIEGDFKCAPTYCKIKNKYSNNKVTIKFISEEEVTNTLLGYIDFNNMEKLYNELSNNELNIEEKNNKLLKGNINVTKDKNVLFLTLGHEKGFKIYVDGQSKNYYNLYGFIGIDLEEGYHEIEIRYEQPYLKLGVAISIGTFILLIICNLNIKQKMNNK